MGFELNEYFNEFKNKNNYFYVFLKICNTYKFSHKEIIKYMIFTKKVHLIDDILEDFLDKDGKLKILGFTPNYTYEYFNVFMVLCRLDNMKMRAFLSKIKNKLYDRHRSIYECVKMAIEIVKNEEILNSKLDNMKCENEELRVKIEELELQIEYMPGSEKYDEAKKEFEKLANCQLYCQ
jgi:predicted nuclease with TOPRIM domain